MLSGVAAVSAPLTAESPHCGLPRPPAPCLLSAHSWEKMNRQIPLKEWHGEINMRHWLYRPSRPWLHRPCLLCHCPACYTSGMKQCRSELWENKEHVWLSEEATFHCRRKNYEKSLLLLHNSTLLKCPARTTWGCLWLQTPNYGTGRHDIDSLAWHQTLTLTVRDLLLNATFHF